MILGVYAKTKRPASGFGGSHGPAEQKTYWFVRRLDDDTYEVQPLGRNHLPTGMAVAISKRCLMTEYVPEIDYFERRTLPVMQSLQRKLDRGEELFQSDQLDAAEKEFAKILFIDEQNPQANLRLGDICCLKKDTKRLKKVLQRILINERIFVDGMRHRFNEFGMNLRKNGLLEEALGYYSKAIAMNGEDEFLYFNAARVLWEMDEKEQCREHLEKALQINPEFEEARRFLNYNLSNQANHQEQPRSDPLSDPMLGLYV